ncbi:succinylglutamate desuccinylase/aspartoacylase family protein [Halobium salinum]|uniref:Succinylglutamate desuccinylase/aspartoacylase family protein n=1 Tax=Halobium salinum TaxID=1364940 RepID=A0ABD5P7G0_9EURY|nr:succinylglutamate desuccinylase/aspartoacylase family protein [Halobium salinum]
MTRSRRHFLRAVGAAGGVGAMTSLTGCGADSGQSTDGASRTNGTAPETSTGESTTTETTTATPAPEQAVDRRLLMEGTDDETPLVRIDAPEAGPTVVLVGGLHGDEVGGWRAATAATEWTIDAGSLVVIPKAAIRAVEARQRMHPEWGNANRMFPLDAEPRSPLGTALWEAVEASDPDYVVDLHSSKGIYSESAYYGQHVFRTEGLAAATTETIEYLNAEVVPDSRPAYEFTQAPIDVDYEMLVRKANHELGAETALFEVTEKNLDTETQVAWTTAYVEKLLDVLGVRAMDRSEE